MNYIITIGRQFGCGAHEITTKLSQRLNIPYYDKEIMKRASKESGFNEKLFHFYDEKPTRSFLYNVSTDGLMAFAGTPQTLEDQIMQYQFNTIKKVSEEGSCIIVGRCAEYILRDNPSLFSVYLHADDDYRLRRVVNQYGYSEKNALKEIKTVDKKRARFHNFYSDENWGEAATYDLCIDVSALGVDKTVDLIEQYVKIKYTK